MFCSKCGTENADEVKFCSNCGNALTAQPAAAQEGSVPDGQLILPASLLKRLLNFFIDNIVRYIFTIAVVIVVSLFYAQAIATLSGFVAFFFYHFIFEALFQQTIGKMVTSTKVVDYSGEKPSILALLGRSLARYIPFEPLSYLFYGGYPLKGWHDRLSHTLVVSDELTPEQVRMIDPAKVKAAKSNSGLVIIVILVAGVLVIATIGIIAAVTLASLNEAREKGRDASTRASMNNIRSYAELYYDDNSFSYEGLCEDPRTISLLNLTYDGNNDFTCEDDSSWYVLSKPLLDGRYYCIDSAGSAEIIAARLSENQTSCMLSG